MYLPVFQSSLPSFDFQIAVLDWQLGVSGRGGSSVGESHHAQPLPEDLGFSESGNGWWKSGEAGGETSQGS